MLTKRQQLILDIVVENYIELGEPISSQFIEENCNLGVSPATIRNDLKKLVKEGYLDQPHTSAGRVPADKGYRYFVNKLLKKKRRLQDGRIDREIRKMEEGMEELDFLRELTGFLATMSSSLTYSYLMDKNLFWKEGFEEAFHDPEFEDITKVHSFLEMVKKFEARFENDFFQDLERSEIRIYIGKESPLGNEDFSIMVSRYCYSHSEDGVVALLGPKRMAYDKNIAIVNSLIKILEKKYNDRQQEDR